MKKKINEGSSLNICQIVKVWWTYTKKVWNWFQKFENTWGNSCKIKRDTYNKISVERNKCLNNSNGIAR